MPKKSSSTQFEIESTEETRKRLESASKKNKKAVKIKKRSTTSAKKKAGFINDDESMLFDDDDNNKRTDEATNEPPKKSKKGRPSGANSIEKIPDLFSIPAMNVEMSKKINSNRTQLHNIIKNTSKEYKQSLHRLKEKMKNKYSILNECNTILTNLNVVKKKIILPMEGKKVVDLVKSISDQVVETLKCITKLEQGIIKQGDEMAQIKASLHTIETGVKADLAKIAGRSSFVITGGSTFEASNTIKQNPIVIYQHTPIQDSMIG